MCAAIAQRAVGIVFDEQGTIFFYDRRNFPATFQAVIPRSVRLSEAPSFGQPILLYDVDCLGAQSYLALALELVASNSSAVPWAARSS